MKNPFTKRAPIQSIIAGTARRVRGALQKSEFSDETLPPGVAFCKLTDRLPERIRCWRE